ncbi:MAG: GIY-YIG nuclease family protein [Clostridiales bacterium]|nr:GIY-YIG nuclease family protein [Clostridiales bacterium]
MPYYTYITTNKRKTVLYVGVTNDLVRRIAEHKSGTVEGFTKRYNVDMLVYVEKYDDIETAIRREKQIKSWSRASKEKLIEKVNKDWTEILPF